MTILKFNDVSKVFYSKTQETTAIDKLSFGIEEGEFVAILGPSGCGKTTILSLISQLIKPTSGSVDILSDNKNAVGYMLQRDHLFEWRTIYKNITLGLEIQKKLTPETEKYALQLIEKYGLSEFKNHHPSELSGGMRQRVALIRTLATSPDVLLLDEPFSALDFQTRLAVCDDVHSIIKKERKTAILVTHDISEAISMSDRIIVLTKRPAKLKCEHLTNFEETLEPLKRRESPEFSKQFEILYKHLSGEQS
ncbi:MAG: ABC transporter ATP-binding protein [Corallococcus sp.]|nr:ABC transporter ATP-binding protein [Corallococcus sp.]